MSVSRQDFYQYFFELTESGQPFVCVTLVYTSGSAPQDQGAKMLVTGNGLFTGTVGGGKIEKKALEEAKLLLREKKENQIYREWNLNHDVGMTCGGNVKLYFELININRWNIVVFGAGHVAQALVPLLTTLDASITCVDSRQDWLDKLENKPNLQKEYVLNLPDYVQKIPASAFVVLMTMGHTTDKPILIELFKIQEKRKDEFSYIGVIGSRAKAVQLKQDIIEAGLSKVYQEQFYCPIGLDVGNNQPAEIAVSIAGQLLQERDKANQNREIEQEREIQWVK